MTKSFKHDYTRHTIKISETDQNMKVNKQTCDYHNK